MSEGKENRKNRSLCDGDIELEVSDFGPIVNAKIDLRPLTVFVGPSNTGKSYLAILIYALHRFFGNREKFGYESIHSIRYLREQVRERLSEKSINALLEITNKTVEDSRLDSHTSVTVTPEITDALQIAFNANASAIASEIERCFGIASIQSLTRKGNPLAARVQLRNKAQNRSKLIEHTLTLSRKVEFQTSFASDMQIPINDEASQLVGFHYWMRIHKGLATEIRENDAFQRSVAATEVLRIVAELFLPHAVGVFGMPAYYLPADRTGVMHAHRVVVSALIKSAPTAGLKPALGTPMLSGVLSDFLDQLISIDTSGRHPQSVAEICSMIESKVLSGSVVVEPSQVIDYPQFLYRPSGWKEDLALANASSMVSELAPVVLYLRHLVKLGNVLIVEEPESHLHPAMQVRLIRLLAVLVNSGIRVILTTHSEWLLEELANIVSRSYISNSKPGNTQEEQVALHPRLVGAWLFEPKRRPRGSVVKEINIDESGLYPTDYETVAHALHNDWANIKSQIESKKTLCQDY